MEICSSPQILSKAGSEWVGGLGSGSAKDGWLCSGFCFCCVPCAHEVGWFSVEMSTGKMVPVDTVCMNEERKESVHVLVMVVSLSASQRASCLSFPRERCSLASGPSILPWMSHQRVCRCQGSDTPHASMSFDPLRKPQ